MWDQLAPVTNLRGFTLYHWNTQPDDCVHAKTTTNWDLYWAFTDMVGVTPRGSKRCQGLTATIETDVNFDVTDACGCIKSDANGKPTEENWLTAGFFIRLNIYMKFTSKDGDLYSIPAKPVGKASGTKVSWYHSLAYGHQDTDCNSLQDAKIVHSSSLESPPWPWFKDLEIEPDFQLAIPTQLPGECERYRLERLFISGMRFQWSDSPAGNDLSWNKLFPITNLGESITARVNLKYIGYEY